MAGITKAQVEAMFRRMQSIPAPTSWDDFVADEATKRQMDEIFAQAKADGRLTQGSADELPADLRHAIDHVAELLKGDDA